MAAAIRRWGKQWVIGGDFNCTPEELKAIGWFQLVGGVTVRPNSPTCNDRTIDFFVVSKEMAHVVVGAWFVGDAGPKPHSPVRLVIKAKPNSVMMKTLKPPLAIGPDLPFGPAPFYEEPVHMEASDFEGVVAKVEEQLTHLLGLIPEEAAKTQGRAEWGEVRVETGLRQV